jgi:Ca2+-binding RTX toxin-like protein
VWRGAGNDEVWGDLGDDIMFGGNGVSYDDLLIGADNDFMAGGLGNNRLYGEMGDDYIDGQQGSDSDYGGLGND